MVFCERLSAHSRRTRRIATSTAYGLGDDASVIFAVDHEIGPLIFLTNMVLSGCGRRLHLRVPPWPRRRRVGGAGGRRRDGATAMLAVKHALVAV